jgi:hypothetical protein
MKEDVRDEIHEESTKNAEQLSGYEIENSRI